LRIQNKNILRYLSMKERAMKEKAYALRVIKANNALEKRRGKES